MRVLTDCRGISGVHDLAVAALSALAVDVHGQRVERQEELAAEQLDAAERVEGVERQEIEERVFRVDQGWNDQCLAVVRFGIGQN